MAGPKKPRCTFKECGTAAQRIVGDCGFCDGHYCAKHRLLEDHKCTGLEDVSVPICSANRKEQWWLVGLADFLIEEGLVGAADCCIPSSTNVVGHLANS